MLVLQQLFNLSDEDVEFQVNDRLTFEEFVGLGVLNDIPDAATVAFFRERLRMANVIDELFQCYRDNKDINTHRLPDGWNENPKRVQQKDLDARWAKQ